MLCPHFLSLSILLDSYFQSQVQSKYVVQVQNVCLLISAGVKIVLIVLKMPVFYFALALTLDGILLATGLVIIYRKKALQKISHWQFNTQRANGLLQNSWPLILSAVMISLYMQIDLVTKPVAS